MKKYLIIALLAPAFFGSCCKRFYPVSVRDSVRVDTRIQYVEKLRDTTVYVPVPAEAEKIVTPDTASHLENSVSRSDAAVIAGMLHHSLESKPVSIPATVQIKDTETVRDSIVYRDRTETIVQEVNRLTWRQKLWITVGKWISAAVALYAVYRANKRFGIISKLIGL